MPLFGEEESLQMKESLRHMIENMELYIEMARLNATLKREHYLKLVEEGFSENQALILTKKFRMGQI